MTIFTTNFYYQRLSVGKDLRDLRWQISGHKVTGNNIVTFNLHALLLVTSLETEPSRMTTAPCVCLNPWHQTFVAPNSTDI